MGTQKEIQRMKIKVLLNNGKDKLEWPNPDHVPTVGDTIKFSHRPDQIIVKKRTFEIDKGKLKTITLEF
jgi:hypothetical protein